MVHTIKSAGDFEKQIAEAGNRIVVLDFYATWCGPCKEMEPVLRKLDKTYKEKALVIKINVDKFQDISDYYKVRSMPTFVFLKNSKRVSSFSGADPQMLTQKMATLCK